MNLDEFLPDDGFRGTLLCRVQVPAGLSDGIAGPSPALIREDGVFDVSHLGPTCSELLESKMQKLLEAAAAPALPGRLLGSPDDLLANSMTDERDTRLPWLLAPVDLQPIKACGVTFVRSLLERVIEERADGDPSRAAAIRQGLSESLGASLATVVPGSAQAEHLKKLLLEQGMWSQYLEVGIGPYAEVFTKCQPLSAVGHGDFVGINEISHWNNPEPELVLIVDSKACIVGATLGNDVNLRDIEGRSALLLGKAKDNNASASMGPFIRLLDDSFSLEDLKSQELQLRISGEDGFVVEEQSSLSHISRDVTELVAQTINRSHQYPDGLALFTGTLFAPIQDRDSPGKGFTHHLGDVVKIRSSHLGCLQNRVTFSHLAPPWNFGIAALVKNLAARGLLVSRAGGTPTAG
jgi:fumarylacetoacetate (FAA) hydrolase family protein